MARGFADLGYEEFYLLPQNKLVSIYTGENSQYNPAERDFFFLVPDTKQLIAELNSRECEITSLEHQDNREWVLSVSDQNHNAFKACLLYTSPSPRDKRQSRMPSSA